MKEFMIFLIYSLTGRNIEIGAIYQNWNIDGRSRLFLEQNNLRNNKNPDGTFVE